MTGFSQDFLKVEELGSLPNHELGVLALQICGGGFGALAVSASF